MTPSQRDALVATCVAGLSKDEPTQCAAVWALLWLTGAKIRARGNRVDDTSKPHPLSEYVLLDPPIVRRIESILREPGVDPSTLARGCLISTRQRGLDLVGLQFDWIYELARIADGVSPRRNLPAPRPTGRCDDLEWMRVLLLQELPPRCSDSIALALGSLGVFVSEMIDPLWEIVINKTGKEDGDIRDEALVYLAWIGTAKVAALLTTAADTPPEGKDDYVYVRGMFGLLLLDDVDVLAAQLRKALPHSDLNLYAFALAGSRDPRGHAVLDELKAHPDERTRKAVSTAFARSWMRTG